LYYTSTNYYLSIVYPELPLFQQPVFQDPDWLPFASALQLADSSLTGQQRQLTLLQQALPQIPTAIYDTRDAMLQQGARLDGLVRTVLDGRLAGIEGNINCLINAQITAA
jgi:hypothetical protein